MDNIYSRKRIKLPKMECFKYKEKGVKKKSTKIIFGIFLIAIISATSIINQLNPIFNELCSEKAKALGTEIINIKSNNAFRNIRYEDLVDIVKDEKRKYKYA